MIGHLLTFLYQFQLQIKSSMLSSMVKYSMDHNNKRGRSHFMYRKNNFMPRINYKILNW